MSATSAGRWRRHAATRPRSTRAYSDFLEQVLTGAADRAAAQRLLAPCRCCAAPCGCSNTAARWTAKGLEDTAFYRYNRFIALNEVGGDPERFGGTLAAFHRAANCARSAGRIRC